MSDDSYLVDTGVVNAEGQRYYAAVKVEDLSGLINVNTAYSTNPADFTGLWPFCQLMVGFPASLSVGDVNDIHNKRLGSAGPNLLSFFQSSVSRLSDPDGYYEPFAVDEESFLRWLGTTSPAVSNRLPALLPADRQLLTATGSSRMSSLAGKGPIYLSLPACATPALPGITGSILRP